MRRLVFILLLLAYTQAKKQKAGWMISVVKAGNCEEYSNHINRLEDVRLIYRIGGVDARLVLNQTDIPAKVVVKFTTTKCTSADDDHCEYYLSGVVDLCQALMDTSQFYSSAFAAIHPRLKCPLKQGIYHIRNATLNLEFMQQYLRYVPDEYYNHHWHFRIVIAPKGQLKTIIGCITCMLKLTTLKANH